MDHIKVKESIAGKDIGLVDTGEITDGLQTIFGQYNRLMPPIATPGVVRSAVAAADASPDLAALPAELLANMIGFGPAASKISMYVEHSDSSGTCVIIPVIFDLDGDDSADPIGTLAAQTSTASAVVSGALYMGPYLSWDIPAGKGVGFLITTLSGSNTVSLYAGIDDQGDNIIVQPWLTRFSDTYWTGSTGAIWDGTKWSNSADGGGFYEIALYEKDSFLAGYRGTKMKVSFSFPSGELDMNIQAKGDPTTYICDVDPANTGDELTLSWAGAMDIAYLAFLFSSGNPDELYDITNIQFSND